MSEHYQFPFEKLRVWQHARKWVRKVYISTGAFPNSEIFNLTSQMKRAVVSVTTNLAEGSARSTGKDQEHFSNLAYSSLMETAYLSLLARDQNYRSEKEMDEQRTEISAIANPIHALRNTQLKKGC